jgi:hypothetical protein
MSMHFYSGQIRRYLTQLIRMFSNFTVQDNSGRLKQIPVMYGDLTRQVASIIKENSENKLPTVPRMSVYITGMEIDRERTSDASFVSKINIRERAYDSQGEEYLNTQGKNYTVERLMPTPYKLTVNVDIWSSNTDQKLQILEQIAMLFNPSLELQTTDNYIDWTSITTVELNNIVFSSRTIPVGTESEIDIATMTFTTPIYISPPAKVKRLGVITNIITSVFNETTGSIELNLNSNSVLEENRFTIEETRTLTDTDGNSETIVDRGEFPNTGTGEMDISVTRTIKPSTAGSSVISNAWLNLGVYIVENKAYIVDKKTIGEFSWKNYFDAVPGCYKPNISQIRLTLSDNTVVVGTVSINPQNENELIIIWDTDSFPTNTVIEGRSTIDYIIDPLRWNPNQAKTPGLRLLLLGKIGNTENSDGADGWKNTNGSDFIADENDIVEWNGTSWRIVFDASTVADTVYTANLNTGHQYKWNGEYWTKSFEGEYPNSAWRMSFE